ncbi:LTA synthase family protein [bacterium]|nr:LTA synthase family protein [bacterium]
MSNDQQQLSIPKRIVNLFAYFLFWLLFFQIMRLFFAVYNHQKFSGLSITEIIQVLYYSLRIDISAVSYIFIIIFFLLIFNDFIRKRFISKIITYYSYIWIILIAFISVTDAQIYKEWGSKINNEVLSFFGTPTEMFSSIVSSPVILLIILFIVSIALGIILYNQLFKLSQRFPVPMHRDKLFVRIFKLTFFYFLLFILIVLGVRGGIQLAPMNPSFAYFSTHDILNNTAINPTWNLIYSIFEQPENRDYYLHFTPTEADSLLSAYQLPTNNNTPSIFELDGNPNVILVIIESFTADIVKSLGGLSDVTPNLDSLIQGGLSFQNFYASGNRTYKSLPAILNGYPSLPVDRVIKYKYIIEKFPSIAHTLNKQDYFSSFYYGGETEFANIRALVIESGFDSLIDQHDFKDSEKNSKWGAHDHVVFERVLNDIESYSRPFFTTILTLSNHEPFEVPTQPVFKDENDHNAMIFKNTAAYTDQCIGDFIRKASKKEWFNNTIFIFTADHGHHYAKHRINKKNPEMFHIPLVIYSNLLKNEYAGNKITKFASQSDIAALLFSQIQLDHSDFIWSKNVLNPSQTEFAYYGFVDGFGWLTKENIIVYDNLAEQIIFSSGDEIKIEKSLKIGQAYLQSLYQYFLSY